MPDTRSIYLPIEGEHKVSTFGYNFLVVPSDEVQQRMVIKDPGKNNIFSFCFHFQDRNVWDERVRSTLDDPRTEYSQFLNAWEQVDKALQ
jgi:hypothetical protein